MSLVLRCVIVMDAAEFDITHDEEAERYVVEALCEAGIHASSYEEE
jgi:hypothetical protein